ncbi:hypothetical protein D3C80_1759720 [compost metagenome]
MLLLLLLFGQTGDGHFFLLQILLKGRINRRLLAVHIGYLGQLRFDFRFLLGNGILIPFIGMENFRVLAYNGSEVLEPVNEVAKAGRA